MSKEHFELCVEPDGTEYVIQKLDEKDKNHGVKDTEIPIKGKCTAHQVRLNFNSTATRSTNISK